MSFEACLLKTIYPALHAALGTLGRVIFVLGSRGQQIDVPETVIFGVHGIHSVDERLHLAGHLIVIYGRRPADDIGIHNDVHYGGDIVLEHTGTGFLTRQAADTELYFFASKGDKLNFVSGRLGAFGEPLRQRIAVGTWTEAG